VIEASEVQEAAHAIGQRIIVSKAGSEGDLVAAFVGTPAALLIAGSPFFTRQRDQLVALAAHHAVPTVYEWREFATAGRLISYGPSKRRRGDRIETCLLQCMSPLLMLWTAPPPAREYHGCGGC
jgi:hypothetical protein